MRNWLLVLGLLAVAAVLGCGELDDALDAAQARVALAFLGIDYTERAFVRAAGDGDLAVVKLFVEAGMSVDARGWSGRTALMYAARGGNLEVVEYLLGRGASLTATDSGGETVLHDAVAGGHGLLWRVPRGWQGAVAAVSRNVVAVALLLLAVIIHSSHSLAPANSASQRVRSSSAIHWPIWMRSMA